MDRATAKTVLGDFSGVNFSHHGIESRMFQEGERYYIRTEGPDGIVSNFEVKYVFGVTPLQQYLVEFDRHPEAKDSEIGRLQTLRIAWNTLKKEWFYLPPPDVPGRILPGDDLHWTGAAQRWNSMCADCHSTDLRKNFDVQAGRYRTTFAEIDVSCEACHGAGGTHVELAKSFSLFWDRKLGKAIGGFAKADPEKELGACFRCHSRRQMLSEDFEVGQTLSDVARVENLAPQTYHCDGQILDEVYEHGSFLQSRMYAKGIRCSDCHDPHSLRPKRQGNRLCTSCHQHPAGKYDSPAHHKHQPGGAGAQCVDCHMPSKTYMEIDVRRDHSLRVPRPDQSAALGTPNACTGCHVDAEKWLVKAGQQPVDMAKTPTPLRARNRNRDSSTITITSTKRREDATATADSTSHSDTNHSTTQPLTTNHFPKPTDYPKLLELRSQHPEIDAELKRLDVWAAEQIVKWYGSERKQGAEWAPLLSGHWKGEKGSDERLAEVVEKRTFPPVVRAAALSQMQHATAKDQQRLIDQLDDPSPLVRASACSAAENFLPSAVDLHNEGLPEEFWRSSPLVPPIRGLVAALRKRLSDPVKSVRVEAARVLAKLPRMIRGPLLDSEERAAFDVAIDEWRAAMNLQNDRSGAHTSLGVYFEYQQDWDAAREAYKTAIRIEPEAIGPRSNLSVLLERVADDLALPIASRRFTLQAAQDAAALRAESKILLAKEAELFERDLVLAPQLAPLHYQYALLQVRLKNLDAAEKALRKALELDPENESYQFTLEILLKERKR